MFVSICVCMRMSVCACIFAYNLCVYMYVINVCLCVCLGQVFLVTRTFSDLLLSQVVFKLVTDKSRHSFRKVSFHHVTLIEHSMISLI